MPSPPPLIDVSDLRRGINQDDPLFLVSADSVVYAENVDWLQGAIAKRRQSFVAVPSTGLPANGASIRELFLHQPATVNHPELWALVDRNEAVTSDLPAFARMPTLDDTWTIHELPAAVTNTNAAEIQAVSFNGKLFVGMIALPRPVDAQQGGLLVIDDLFSPGTLGVRFVGLPAPLVAPTPANTGSGSYPAIQRYYRIRSRRPGTASATATHRSEPSPSVAFTPSGSGTGVTVTRPSTTNFPNENGLDGASTLSWELEASLDDVVYYRIATVANSTASVVDNNLTTDYADFPLSHPVGEYTRPHRFAYLVVDDNRLILAHVLDTTPSNHARKSQVFWTPVYGEFGVSDDERVPSVGAHSITLDAGKGGAITGLVAHNRAVHVFKTSRFYRLVRTGRESQPYRSEIVSETVGCVDNRTIVPAEDEFGQPCLYWLGLDGPYRLGPQGIQFLGRDLLEVWDNRDTLRTRGDDDVPWYGVGVFIPRIREVRWILPQLPAGSTANAIVARFDISKGRSEGFQVRGGWTLTTGLSTSPAQEAAGQTMALGPRFAGDDTRTDNRLAAFWAMRSLDPPSGSPVVRRLEAEAGDTAVSGTIPRAYFRTRAYELGGPDKFSQIEFLEVTVRHTAAVHLRFTAIVDFGTQTGLNVDVTVPAPPAGDITVRRVDLLVPNVRYLQLEVGDWTTAPAYDADQAWTIEGLRVFGQPGQSRAM